MLTQKERKTFEINGFVVLRKFLNKSTLRSLKVAVDGLRAKAPCGDGRWSLRNCLSLHPAFLDVLMNKTQLTIVVQLLGFNVKLLGSHAVTMQKQTDAGALCVDWHRDGGALLAELPDPLPPLFIKTGLCISGSPSQDGGELLIIPGSHHLNGELAIDSTGLPFGISRILLEPSDMVIFDWRVWHAVAFNKSNAVRRMLYFTFGFRWLSPFDYQMMPQELFQRSPIHRQLLGGATLLGNILPTDKDVPMKELWKKGGDDHDSR